MVFHPCFLFSFKLINDSPVSQYNFCFATAGDHVKFGFPAAAAMTVLAWGGISYEAGYKSAGEWEYLLDAVKWGTDYFIKCHVSDDVFYGQVG